MKAVREKDSRPAGRKKKRRLAYEIAIGVLIAQVLFWPIEKIANYLLEHWEVKSSKAKSTDSVTKARSVEDKKAKGLAELLSEKTVNSIK